MQPYWKVFCWFVVWLVFLLDQLHTLVHSSGVGMRKCFKAPSSPSSVIKTHQKIKIILCLTKSWPRAYLGSVEEELTRCSDPNTFVSLQYPTNGSTSGDRNSDGRARYRSWNDAAWPPEYSVCVKCTQLAVYNWLTNTPLQVHPHPRRCVSCGQDKRAFSSLQIPPRFYWQKIIEADKCYWKKKRTKYRRGPQLTVVLCVVFLSPSSLWAVWAARGCPESSSPLPGLGQDDSLGGLLSKECWIKPIPIPQFPDTRLYALLECLTTAGIFYFFSGKQVLTMF